MTDVIQDAEKAVSAATAVSGVASAAGNVVDDAAKLATGAVSGIFTGLLPYILGIFGAVILGLAVTVFIDHHWTIPTLEANLKAADADINIANGQTVAANQAEDKLQVTVQQQNQQIADLQGQLAAANQRAAAAGTAAAHKPLPKPPTDLSWVSVKTYLLSLRSAP